MVQSRTLPCYPQQSDHHLIKIKLTKKNNKTEQERKQLELINNPSLFLLYLIPPYYSIKDQEDEDDPLVAPP